MLAPMNEELEYGDLLDGAACDATSDLTARLLADLTQAQAELAVAEGRVHSALASGATVAPELRSDRILARQKVAVLYQVLDGMPSIEGDREGECHAESA